MGLTRKVPYSMQMSPVMAAPRVIVCAVVLLILGVTPAHAQRRPVAVVNLDLGSDPAPQELATQLDAVLREHPELRTLPAPGDTAALYERVDDDDTPRLARARNDLVLAEQQLEQFNPAQAVRIAEEGEQELLLVTPSLAARLFADLAFVRGRALLEEGRGDEARVAFAHSHTLDPTRTLDPAKIVPDVVAAYEAAKVPPGSPGMIDVKGSGNVWIDGAELGIAPATFAASAGRHVVWLTGVDRETRGLAVAVAPGATVVAEIPEAEAPRRTKVQRARQALARAPDPTARAAAMRRLAELAGVKDAVLLSVSGGKVIVQTWRAGDVDRAPGFSALRERRADRPVELLAPLAPPKVVIPVEEPPRFVLPPPKRWYQRRPVQVGIVAGVLAAIAGGIMISRAGPDSFLPQTDIVNDDPGSLNR